jgi:3,4-dihydroxy 2-butanone 4-phosphate synthase/GTP cyclohydrolase II
MLASWVDRLGLPSMVPDPANTSRFGTGFTISVEARQGVTTGISAFDRPTTIQKLADPAATLADFAMPGQVFPLRAREDAVHDRTGQTEASVDLARLAGLSPVAVICEIMKDDGRMARLPDLEVFAARHSLNIISVADLVAWRAARERGAHCLAETTLPTDYGRFRVLAYDHGPSREVDLALVLGDISGDEPILARVHSECLTGDVLGSQRCDCGEQLDRALDMIGQEGRGVLLYMRQEGRGIGLLNKLKAYHLQDQGFDTVEANVHLGFPADARDYSSAVAMLRDLGAERVRLMTNNPRKVDALSLNGIDVVERVPLVIPSREQNQRYLDVKRRKLGHWLEVGAEVDRANVKTG